MESSSRCICNPAAMHVRPEWTGGQKRTYVYGNGQYEKIINIDNQYFMSLARVLRLVRQNE